MNCSYPNVVFPFNICYLAFFLLVTFKKILIGGQLLYNYPNIVLKNVIWPLWMPGENPV